MDDGEIHDSFSKTGRLRGQVRWRAVERSRRFNGLRCGDVVEYVIDHVSPCGDSTGSLVAEVP